MRTWITSGQPQRGRLKAAVAAALVLISLSERAWSQPPAVPVDGPTATADAELVTIEDVTRRLQELDQVPGLDDTARTEIRGLLEESLRDLTAARDLAAQREALAAQARMADQRLEVVRFQLAAPPPSVAIEVPADATLAKLEELLNEEEKKLDEAKRQRERLNLEQARRQARRAELPEKIRELQEALAVLETEWTAAAAPAGPKADANRLRIRARMLALDAEIKLAEQELATYVATTDLVQPELDLAQREASLAEKRVAEWRRTVELRRQTEVQRQAEAARLEAATTTGPLQPLATRNSELAERSAELLAKIQLTNRSLESAKSLLDRVQQKFTSTQEKVKQVGLNYTIGLLLRREDGALPSVREYRHDSRERARIIREVQLELMELSDERSRLTDVDFIESFLRDIPALPDWLDQRNVEEALRGLVDTQLKTLSTLQQNLNGYFDRLVELDSTERQLVQAVTAYQNYIDEHVLWIQSSDLLSLEDLRRAWLAMKLLLSRADWWNLAVSLGHDFVQWLVPALLLLLIWLLLLLAQPRLRESISQLGDQAASGSCRRYSVTWVTLICTLLITVTWPLLMLFLAWRLLAMVEGTDFAKMVGAGLQAAAITYLVLEFLRQVCRARGLADTHFHWPEGVRVTLRCHLRWLMVVSVPWVFLAATCNAGASSQATETLALGRAEEALSRLSAIAALMAAVVFAQRILWPQGPLFADVNGAGADTRLYRFRHLWYALALGGLVSLLALSVIGYHYTVFRLASCLLWTILLLEVMFVTAAMVDRWLIIARRRLAIERAQRRSTTGPNADASSGVAPPSLEERSSDLDIIGEQSRRLLHALLVLGSLAVLWLIWIDVLPALGFLERFRLWTVMDNDQARPLTLKSLVVAIVILLVTVLATKNIPGLLELAVLSRLPVNAGTRYAFIAICRYVIIIVGVIVAFSWIGISWGSYQWLVAAVTVGLGFGLQEIFANFVSGLIVLFEQPIRVGDVVTIGDVTGVVSRIRMRATTVTNWDRQDFIVPNKEFITGRLLNWTLTNTVNRVVINVGVAYDSDPDAVRAILLDILTSHPQVLGDPQPTVTFSEFGDSTLNFVLRGFLPTLDERLAVTHELHSAVQRRLTAAGVTFAFPTREVHIRSIARGRPPAQETQEAAAGTAQPEVPGAGS